MIELYPDQEEFIGEIRALYRDNKRIVAMAVTGFGKTRVAARIIEGFTSRGMKVCFVVPRISLVQQTAKSFIDLGLEDITLIWGSYETDCSAKITIASVDSYIRREKGDYDLVIVDEMHHRRKQLLEWMRDHPDDRYVGLTATPFAPWIGRYYTGLAKSKSMRWMIDNGRLADYDIYAPDVPNTSKLKTYETSYGDDYKESDIDKIMGDAKIIGNIVSNWLEHGENRLTMVLPVSVAHANFIAIEFEKAGIAAEVVTAKTPIEERERIFSRVRAEITRIVISVNCLTEGFDIPEISCVINARPTKSEARYLQGIGRGLRKKPDGYKHQNCVIFDHSGTSLKLGLPEDITIDSLKNSSDGVEEGAERKTKEKQEKLPKECPNCKFLKNAGVYICPKCGFKPIVGEDVEVRDDIGLKKIGKKKEYTMDEKQTFYSQLLGYKRELVAQGKQIKDGRIAHIYREKFGVWPKGLSCSMSVPGIEVRNFIKSQTIRYVKSKGKQNANS